MIPDTRHTNRVAFALCATVIAAAPAFAQEAAETAQALAETSKSLSFWELLTKGGYVMIPLALCSVLTVAIAIERFISLSKSRAAPEALEGGLWQKLGGRLDESARKKAADLFEEHESPLAEMLHAGLERWGEPAEDVEKAVAEQGARMLRKMRRSLRSLNVIAAVAPLMGLLGTVLGMIRAFQTVAIASNSLGRPEMLAQGIYEAMVTTATGLTVAIPALVLYWTLIHMVERRSDDFELGGNRFISGYAALQAGKPLPPEPTPAAPQNPKS